MVILLHDDGRSRDKVPREPAGMPAEQPARRQVVLLVEDLDADRDMYGGLLWYNGYEVVHAADGESAIGMALEHHPDLILLDIGLPGGLDGLEVARRLREANLDIPICALTAHSMAELGDAARDAGVTVFLEKPMDPFAVVREVMRQIGYARRDANGT